jgi:hypothetical protein
MFSCFHASFVTLFCYTDFGMFVALFFNADFVGPFVTLDIPQLGHTSVGRQRQPAPFFFFSIYNLERPPGSWGQLFTSTLTSFKGAKTSASPLVKVAGGNVYFQHPLLGARLSASYNNKYRQQVRLQLGIRQAAGGMRLKHLHTTTTTSQGAQLRLQHHHTIPAQHGYPRYRRASRYLGLWEQCSAPVRPA